MSPKKSSTAFLCNECGETFAKWLGKCSSCGAFNSVVAFRESKSPEIGNRSTEGIDLEEKTKSSLESGTGMPRLERIPTGISECDRVLGEGFFPGSLLLFGGHPGIGKSTLALQIFSAVDQAMYFSGEESREQVLSRLKRIGKAGNRIFSTNSLEDIVTTIEKHKPSLAVIDSIQMVGREGGNLGSMAQIRENAEILLQLAKATGTVILLIGHVTKSDELAGPKVLEHLVDVVLYLEGDRNTDLRILKSPKNRFGSTLEVGVFQMKEAGLVMLQNPSEFFLAQRLPGSHGNAITAVREGVRHFLLEIQALTIKTNFGNPRRTSHGLDMAKLHLLLAVVSKFTPFPCYEYDTYLNIVGGLKVQDPAADLGVVAAILSSRLEREIPPQVVLCGEVGLSGEVRSVPSLEARFREVQKLGFARMIGPRLPKGQTFEGYTAITSVKELVKALWGEKI